MIDQIDMSLYTHKLPQLARDLPSDTGIINSWIYH